MLYLISKKRLYIGAFISLKYDTLDMLLSFDLLFFFFLRYEQAEHFRKKSFKIRQKAARRKGNLVMRDFFCVVF